MQNIIYIDVLLVVNFVVNYFLLISASKLAGTKISAKRGVVSALVGAFSCLAIFIPIKNSIFVWLIKIITALFMVAIGFKYKDKRSFFYRVFALFGVSFIFSGFMLGLWIFSPIGGMIYYNGIVYFNISTIKLFAMTILCYLGLCIFEKYVKLKSPKKSYYTVYIERGGKSIKLKGFIDTGNKLTEPFSGFPVAVSDIESLSPIFSGEEIMQILKKDNNLIKGMRLTPCTTVNESVFLQSFIPDKFLLIDEQGTSEVEQIYVAISDKKIHIDDVQILLSESLSAEKSYFIKN